jgi:transcriptional regulator with XRE-family HTH domain
MLCGRIMSAMETAPAPSFRPRSIDRRALGHRIRALREARKLSRRALGELTGLRSDRIASLEAGSAKALLDEAVRISSALSLPLQLLVFGEDWVEDELAAVAARRGISAELAGLLLEAVSRGLEILKTEGRVS